MLIRIGGECIGGPPTSTGLLLSRIFEEKVITVGNLFSHYEFQVTSQVWRAFFAFTSWSNYLFLRCH